jgi:hypothetical protein
VAVARTAFTTASAADERSAMTQMQR